MPKLQGREIISDNTEKCVKKLLAISSIVILTKIYHVDFESAQILGISIPKNLVDGISLALILWGLYSLIINWLSDLAFFRLWYSESDLISEFGTNMKIDKNFYDGGIALLKNLYKIDLNSILDYNNLPATVKTEYEDFKANIELYITRLQYAGKQFKTVSNFAKFYIFVQSFLVPVLTSACALFLLYKYGDFSQSVPSL